ncbi:unnamed protein product [Phytophthora fragariaefolia]|uniref:Unnamed protein product n=1 Tax=Phytophthora fragariaefolia TaxID=1490495 RepID=A0A9W6XG49_9STRA|nr:unnamed protein product [Phytophthora fragariaefolia]
MVPTLAFTNIQVCDFFFKPVLDHQDEPTSFFRCRCSKVREQDIKTGYTNLMSHVRAQHPNFAAEIANSGMAGGTRIAFVHKKSQTVYSWIDWVISCTLPFSFPEDETVVKYASISSISTETLVKCMGLLTKAVEEIVAAILPEKFGIVFDGSTFRSEHYVAVFAVFTHDGNVEKILLAMAPLVDDEVMDHSAPAHVAFLRTIMGFFKCTLARVLHLVGDNCPTNGAVATLMRAPFVGCASHRLNLAVVEYMETYECHVGSQRKFPVPYRNEPYQ